MLPPTKRLLQYGPPQYERCIDFLEPLQYNMDHVEVLWLAQLLCMEG